MANENLLCFPKRKGLKRLCRPEQSESSLTTEPSGRADTNITHGSFSCQMFNSKSVWRQLVCISFSCREVRTDGAALLLLLLLCPHPSTRLPSFQKPALYFQTNFCCKDLLRNSSCGPANGTEARAADLLSSLGPSQQFRAPKLSKLSAIPNPWGLFSCSWSLLVSHFFAAKRHESCCRSSEMVRIRDVSDVLSLWRSLLPRKASDIRAVVRRTLYLHNCGPRPSFWDT